MAIVRDDAATVLKYVLIVPIVRAFQMRLFWIIGFSAFCLACSQNLTSGEALDRWIELEVREGRNSEAALVRLLQTDHISISYRGTQYFLSHNQILSRLMEINPSQQAYEVAYVLTNAAHLLSQLNRYESAEQRASRHSHAAAADNQIAQASADLALADGERAGEALANASEARRNFENSIEERRRAQRRAEMYGAALARLYESYGQPEPGNFEPNTISEPVAAMHNGDRISLSLVGRFYSVFGTVECITAIDRNRGTRNEYCYHLVENSRPIRIIDAELFAAL